ncbi:MAG: sigma-70 family RNA polymerase sigma factor, partial [Lachnospiraceae bacterium]|nr:sigma-70 family RNA polymerase sigma factor [Lachnospiraceae bacterium]
MKPTQNLRQAVISYREGKAEAFTTLYEESSRYIYTCIYKVMQGNDNAQDIISDIMQDTYVEISKNIGQLKDEDSFLSWAGSIATRKCYAWLKKNNRYVLLDEADDTFDDLADSDDIIPEAVMQSREKQRLVREIIDTRLTQMQKLCIIEYYYNEQKQSEIARELGIPENTVKTNLSRAKAKIKDGVLDIEKKQGTKLYSVAPLLLFLFGEEISACVVPHTVTARVNASVFPTKGVGAKTLLEKLASASAKAKITAGIIGVGAAVAVGSTIYVALQDNGGSWEKEYRKILMEDDNAVGFDLNDFEEDGIPELVILEADGSVTLCSYKEGEEPSVSSLKAGEERGDERHKVSEQNHYGYDLEYGRLINLMDVSVSVDGSVADHLTVPIYIQYLNGKRGNSEKASYGYTVGIYPVEWAYFWGDADQYEISEEEAMEHLAEAQSRFNEIIYTDISEGTIEGRFAEFKENGNRERERNSVAGTPAKAGNETVEIQDPLSVSETEITLLDKEQDSLGMLIGLTALSDYFLGNDMTGIFHNSEDMQTTMRFI